MWGQGMRAQGRGHPAPCLPTQSPSIASTLPLLRAVSAAMLPERSRVRPVSTHSPAGAPGGLPHPARCPLCPFQLSPTQPFISWPSGSF